MIAKREGIGNLLAEGTKRAAQKVGKGSEHFAMNVKGLECAGYDGRGFQTFTRGCVKDAWSEIAELYTLTTGIKVTGNDLKLAAERCWNLKKAFNIREGWTRQDDSLP